MKKSQPLDSLRPVADVYASLFYIAIGLLLGSLLGGLLFCALAFLLIVVAVNS